MMSPDTKKPGFTLLHVSGVVLERAATRTAVDLDVALSLSAADAIGEQVEHRRLA